MNEDQLFWKYFILGAETYITKNLNTEAFIVNDIKGFCHSITINDDQGTYDLNIRFKN